MISILNISETEAAVTEPVTLDEVKDWLGVDFDDHDDLLTGMITGARRSIEKMLNLHLVAKTVTMDIENTSKYYSTITFPYAKTVDDVAVNELDDQDAETLLDAGDDYYLRANTLRLDTGRYSVAYTTVPGSISEDLKEAIKMEVAERYRNRGENNKEYVSSVAGLSQSAREKALPYAQIWL